jgi:hypothetical protein
MQRARRQAVDDTACSQDDLFNGGIIGQHGDDRVATAGV